MDCLHNGFLPIIIFFCKDFILFLFLLFFPIFLLL